MNERIEELSLQCIRYKLVAEGARSDFDYKKFAELIVRECLNIIGNSVNNDEYWSRTTGAESIMAIEDHFGVEL